MDNLQFAPVNMVLGKAAAASGTTTTFSASALTMAIKGKAYNVAAAANAATPLTDAQTGLPFVAVPKGSGSVFLFCYDASSSVAATAIKVIQGSVAVMDNPVDDGTNVACNFVSAPNFPVPGDNLTPFAYLVIKVGTGAAAPFVLGTSNLAATSKVSITWQDLITLPARPQVA